VIMKIELTVNEWRFGLWWGTTDNRRMCYWLPRRFYSGSVLLGYVGLVTCFVAVVSLMQWLVLRRVVRQTGFWVPAGIVGFAVSSSIHTAVCYPGNFLLTWVFGSVLWYRLSFGWNTTGLLQQCILRHQVRRSGWWVLASAAGWGLSVIGIAILLFLLA